MTVDPAGPVDPAGDQSAPSAPVVPGEVLFGDGDIELNPGRPRTTLRVVNGGDRPIQVGSHFHLADVNPSLEFDRALALGQRLDIPAGTSVRFDPGVDRLVDVVPLGGTGEVPGLQRRSHLLDGHGRVTT